VPPYNPAGLRQVRAGTWLPLATGERVHVLPSSGSCSRAGLVDIVQADLTHFGGFTGLRKLAGWADAYDLLLAPHNVCGPVGTAANLHLAVATGNYKVLEHFNDFADPWVDELGLGRPAGRPGRRLLRAADRPGAGGAARPRGGRPPPAHRGPLQPGRGGVGAT
jgi:galactonate dehydratase